MKNFKMLVCGIIIGVVVGGAITVGAATGAKVQAQLSPTVKFNFDGELKTLPADMFVLEYADRNYISARFIAETLGAVVTWDEKTETIYIKSAPPEVITTEKEVIKEVEKASQAEYYSLPQTLTRSGVTLEINQINPGSYGYVYIEIRKLPHFVTMLDYENVVIEFPDGTKAKTEKNMNYEWLNSVQVGQKSMLIFTSIPEKQTKFTLVVPFIIEDFNLQKQTIQFSFDVDLTVEVQ